MNERKTKGASNQNWTLSAVGDWTAHSDAGVSQTRTHAAAHELTAVTTGGTTSPLGYDPKGNLLSRPAALASPALGLVWDFDNRLRGADTNGTPATQEVTFEYDALGRRVARSETGNNVVYVHAGQQVIADYARGAAAAAPSFRYVYGSYVDEPLLRHAGTGTTLPTSGTAALYYHRNQQYSIVGLSDAAGSLVERYAYTAYGELTILAPDRTVRTASSFQNRYTYTGREWDATLSLYYFRARWLEPKAGRFIGRDPLGYVDGMGLYGAYFGLGDTDPTGEIKIVNPCLFKGRKKCDSQDVVGIAFDFAIENGHVLEDSKRNSFGYVIQRVEINCEQCDCEIADCENKQAGWLLSRITFPRFKLKCGANCKKGDPVVYYEAWKIGGKLDGKLGLRDRHTFFATRFKCTKRTITAKTRFTKKLNMNHWDKNPNKEFGDGLCRSSPGHAFHYTGKGVPREFELPLLNLNWNRNEPELNYQTSLESDCCSGSNVGPFKITDRDSGKSEIIQ